MSSECKLPMSYNCKCSKKKFELYEFEDSRIVKVTQITKEICYMICNEIDKINCI